MRKDLRRYILFVCVHNSGRSQMAEAFFNQLAGGKAKALSSGTDPEDRVDPTVVQVMGEVGIDISKNRPKALALGMLDPASRVVTLGCGVAGVCPSSLVQTEDWGLEDPKGKPVDEVREVRDEIKARVVRLLEETHA